MENRQHALRCIALKLNVSGTAEVLEEQRLYKGGYGFIKLQVYAPKTQNTEAPILSAFCTTVDELGREVISTHNYRLWYAGDIALGGFEYLLFEGLLPKEFTEKATVPDGLKITFNYCDSTPILDERGDVLMDDNGVPKRRATDLLVSSRYITTVYDGGWNDESMELNINSAEAAQIGENMRHIAELQADVNGFHNELDESMKEMVAERERAESAADTAAEDVLRQVTEQKEGAIREIGETSQNAKDEIDEKVGAAREEFTAIKEKAEDAQKSAQAAATSEGNAAEYEKNAEDARDRAIEAKDAAELAAGQAAGDVLEQLRELKEEATLAAQNAQSAQEGAETAQSETLTAKEAAQAAQQNAETAKEGAEQAQRETLAAKEAAETAQEQTLTLKNEAQEAQTQAETSKEQAGEYAAQTARDAANAIASAQTATEAAARAEEFAKYGIRINTDYSSIESLPRPGNTQLIYFIPNGSSAPNAFDEYVWTESGEYEKIGTTEVDLSAYLTKESAAETYATKISTETAQRAAEAAQNTADEAQRAAKAAQNTADEAQRAAEAAQNTADEALKGIEIGNVEEGAIADVTAETTADNITTLNFVLPQGPVGPIGPVGPEGPQGEPGPAGTDRPPMIGEVVLVWDGWEIDPASYYGGSWEKIATDSAVWFSQRDINTSSNPRTRNAGLPDIIGSFGATRAAGYDEPTGAFKQDEMLISSAAGSGKYGRLFTFHASDGSKNERGETVYGKADTVQPRATMVFGWRRYA